MPVFTKDQHSVGNTDAYRCSHLDWEASVDFTSKIITATATYNVEVIKPDPAILFDCNHISVQKCLIDDKSVDFSLFEGKFGGGLKVEVPHGTTQKFKVTIFYQTTEKCSAAQWLDREQTLGGQYPFLFTQCQAIHARSLIPCQDTPSIKFTYDARVTVDKPLTALMSAPHCGHKEIGDGRIECRFMQPIKIPAYLLALAVGHLQGVKIGPRSTVWAEPELVQTAADEFVDTELFLKTAEEIAGEYIWGVYDLLVLPPSFPYGGMENPCLTFLSPSLIAGDKSLVDVVAHEIAHSWSGNLVTNADWSAFWLNEGFTMFLERRITGRIRGEEYRHFDACLGLTDLRKDIVEHFGEGHSATALCPDMSNMDPDEAYSRVPYEKGHTFLFYLESIVNQDGQDVFGEYLRQYFSRFANESITVAEWKTDFLSWFAKHHPSIHERLVKVDFDKWLFGTGMPPVIPDYDRSMCCSCEHFAKLYQIVVLTRYVDG